MRHKSLSPRRPPALTEPRADLVEGVIGSGYRSEILYTSDEQRKVA